MGCDLVSELLRDLHEDAERLATGVAVAPEIERRAVGRIGLLVCEISRGLWSREDLIQTASEVAKKAVSDHVAACASFGAGGGRGPWVVLFLDRYFRHIWWGLVLLCCVFGIREVVDAITAAARTVGG
jgi:hypothetical protein